MSDNNGGKRTVCRGERVGRLEEGKCVDKMQMWREQDLTRTIWGEVDWELVGKARGIREGDGTNSREGGVEQWGEVGAWRRV